MKTNSKLQPFSHRHRVICIQKKDFKYLIVIIFWFDVFEIITTNWNWTRSCQGKFILFCCCFVFSMVLFSCSLSVCIVKYVKNILLTKIEMLNNLISISSLRSTTVKFFVYLGGQMLGHFDRIKI